MKFPGQLRFRTTFILMLLMATLVNLGAAGSLILLVRLPRIAQDSRNAVQAEVNTQVRITEGLLANIQNQVSLVARATGLLAPADLDRLLDAVTADAAPIQAIYCVDESGKTIAASLKAGQGLRRDDLTGIDLSYSPLYRQVRASGGTVWSDKYLSVFSGDSTVGLAVLAEAGVVIAEIPLPSLLDTLKLAAARENHALWLVDRNGELLADSEGRYGLGLSNVGRIPVVEQALKGEPLPATVVLNQRWMYPAAAGSATLGWVFLAFYPADMANPQTAFMLADMIILTLGSLVLAFLLAPLWALFMGRQVETITLRAQAIAADTDAGAWKPLGTREFNDLALSLRHMADRIRQREEALKELNLELEDRVRQRTQALEVSNLELLATVDNLRMTQEELVQSEKLAALGRMVAGVAHELNTPIGNGLMAVSNMRSQHARLTADISQGLTKSSFDNYVAETGQGLEIAFRNLERAVVLVNSFKQVASDQASSQRRSFVLADMVREIIMTMHPSIRKHQVTIDNRIDLAQVCDSYPGVLGQVLGNLIQNALNHAWEPGSPGGTISLTASLIADSVPTFVQIDIQDNGKGIPLDIQHRIFEPFFTTRRGQGGTGLGLHIVHNSTLNILGGNVWFNSSPGSGTCFHVAFPVVAPRPTPETSP